jgi:flagella synthesis protein FlgN
MSDALLGTVIEEYITVEAFASLLLLEEKALAAVSPLETLPALLAEKTALTDKLAALSQARDEHLHELGLPPGLKGMELACAKDASLARRWKHLQATVERARRANTNNGLMIRVRMNYNQSALAILRGSTQKAAVYGPDGRMAGY